MTDSAKADAPVHGSRSLARGRQPCQGAACAEVLAHQRARGRRGDTTTPLLGTRIGAIMCGSGALALANAGYLPFGPALGTPVRAILTVSLAAAGLVFLIASCRQGTTQSVDTL
jgi:hypothetical protein